ncbi:hypothetical protein ACFFRR_006895 [Megaselia abdita]
MLFSSSLNYYIVDQRTKLTEHKNRSIQNQNQTMSVLDGMLHPMCRRLVEPKHMFSPEEEKEEKKQCFTIKRYRFVQTLVLFLILLPRINIGVVVLAMSNNKLINPHVHLFSWSTMEKVFIVNCNFVGAALAGFPSGYLAQKLGSRLTVMISMLLLVVFQILTPTCVLAGDWQICSLMTFLQSICECMMLPCLDNHLANWSPVKERSIHGSIVYCGNDISKIFSNIICGVIASSSFGWPGIYYLFGLMNMLLFLVWLVFGENTPSSSKFITNKEKVFIEDSLKEEVSSDKTSLPIPWCQIFSSGPVWALICISSAMLVSTAISKEISIYMDSILDMDIESISLIQSCQLVIKIALSFVLPFILHGLATKCSMTLDAQRKMCSSISTFIPATAVIAVCFLHKDFIVVTIILLMLNSCMKGAKTIGIRLNILDLSPNFAPVISGFTTAISDVFSVIVILGLNFFDFKTEDETIWNFTFGILALILIVGNIVYLIFGKMTAQSWNFPENRQTQSSNRY